MTNTQLEVTVKAVLSAVEGDIERLPTDQKFFDAFDGMADKLYDIDGLVDPALWGQASNGQIELLLCFPNSGDARAAAARAMSVVREVSAAAGVGLYEDRERVLQTQGATGPADRLGRVTNVGGGRPRLVLKGTHHTAEIVPA